MKKIAPFIALVSLLLSTGAMATSGKILQIGDSQSEGIFGKAWHQKIRTSTKNEFKIVARHSSSVQSYFNYNKLPGTFRVYEFSGKVKEVSKENLPVLKELLKEESPDTIIVQLGGNMILGSDDSIRTSVQKMVSLVKESANNCIWIGPPNGHKRPQPRFGVFYKVLRESVEKEGCQFVDSRPYTNYPNGVGDGIHFDSLIRPLGREAVNKLVNAWVEGIYKVVAPLL